MVIVSAMPTLESKLEPMIRRFTQELADAIKENLSETIAEVLRRNGPERGLPTNGSANTRALQAPSAASPPQVTKADKPVKKSGRTYPPHCLYEGCSSKHMGPRFSFLCQEHVGISKAQKTKLQEAWRKAQK